MSSPAWHSTVAHFWTQALWSSCRADVELLLVTGLALFCSPLEAQLPVTGKPCRSGGVSCQAGSASRWDIFLSRARLMPCENLASCQGVMLCDLRYDEPVVTVVGVGWCLRDQGG